MTRLRERHEALAACESMCRIARIAVRRFEADALATPALLAEERVRPREVRDLVADIEPTYLVRMFAIFETTLRDFWENGLHRPTLPPCRQLLDALASDKCPQALQRGVHEVREYRNFLVHGGESRSAIAIGEAKRRLCAFQAMCLRREW